MSQTNLPVEQKDRIVSLDVLRGFALMGILIVNIQSFSMVGSAYSNPTVYGDLSGSNYAVWFTIEQFFESKMMSIFSMLFGAGIVLVSERAEKRTGKSGWLNARRMFWLILFGLAHAHLLWYGDILFSYGMCGLAVYWLRNWRPKWQLITAMVMLTIPSLLMVALDYGLDAVPEMKSKMNADWQPNTEKINAEIEIYRGSWTTQFAHRSPTALVFQTMLLGMVIFWRAGGLMLIGMALYKWNVLSAVKSNRFYITAMLTALLVGLSLVHLGIRHCEKYEWAIQHSMLEGKMYNYWGSIMVAFGYACGIMLVCRNGLLTWLQRAFQAAGQMALTNYLMQTIICTTIFYGHGFGWFGSVNRTNQFLIVVAIWVFQLSLSPVWMKRFRFGPFEWLWRSLVYWKAQPIMRSGNS